MAAITAADLGKVVLLLEKNEKLGRKIYATGNGKCNFTNRYQSMECYRSTKPFIAWNIIRQFDFEKTIAFFDNLGILPKEKNGYFYPNSEQASSIAEVLCMEIKRQKVTVICKSTVVDIKKVQDSFNVYTKECRYLSKQVIIASGGMASPIHGSDGSGYDLAKKFGHHIVTPLPALTQLKAEEKYFKTLSGVRVDARGSLFSGKNHLAEESGEFLFTSYGISGIPILQMSRFAAATIYSGKEVHLSLDFFPDINENKLQKIIKKRYDSILCRTVEEALTGVLNHKLFYVLLKELRLNPEEAADTMDDKNIYRLCHMLKQFTFRIIGTNGFENAQVTAGGVDLKEINENTLESLLIPGLFFAGEVVDVDGTCGGYNLQWAFSSGRVAAESLRKLGE